MQTENLRLKACIHCVHFRAGGDAKPRCMAAAALNGLDYVMGVQGRKSPYEMRGNLKLCGPDGKHWASKPRPIADRVAVAGMVAAHVAGKVAALPGRADEWRRGLGARLRHRLAARLLKPEMAQPIVVEAVQVIEAVEAATDANVAALRKAAADMREGMPIEPLPAPEPAPVPGELPQTEGKQLGLPLERNAKDEARLGVAVVLACIAFLAGILVAHAISPPRASATDRTFGAATARCIVAKRKATCCYRWHDGSTRCFDCSDTA